MKTETKLKLLAALIAAMFFYASLSKLSDYALNLYQMKSQIFPVWMAMILAWLIPVIELFVALGLLFRPIRLRAFYAAFALLLLFSIYIVIAMSGAFGRIPCSCGGILKNMTYWNHLIFNLTFMFLAVLGIAIEQRWIFSGLNNRSKERRSVKIS